MWKYPKYLLLFLGAGLNFLVVVGMMACAFSQWVKPQDHPDISYFGLAFPFFLLASVLFMVFWLLVKRRYAMISLVGCVCCAASIRTYFPVNMGGSVPEGAIKVLSYNVCNFVNDKGKPLAEQAILNYIVQANADIVCLQETKGITHDDVDSLLSLFYPYRSTIDYRQVKGTLLSKFPILRIDTIGYISKSNYSVAYDIRVGSDTVLVVNNHFESYRLQAADREEYKEMIQNPEESLNREHLDGLTTKLATATAIRGAQADSVDQYIRQSGRSRVIACGDFNDASISYVHYRMTRMLNDAYTRSGNGPGLSYNRSGMYFRIDNILCSPNIRPYGAKVDGSIDASDHYPIYCWLQLE